MKSRSGFTIVELLIVIVVIAILAAISIVAYNGVQVRANVTKVQADLKGLQAALEIYKAENNSYPTTGGSWSYSANSPSGYVPGLVPTYVASLPQLTIGTVTTSNCYIYKSNGVDYKLMRLGQPLSQAEQDLVPDSMKDVGNWNSYHDRYGYWSSGGATF